MPPREIRELFVPADRWAKLAAKHPPISIEEVRQAVGNASSVQKGPKNQPGQVGKCYFVESVTDAGRPLKVLVRRYESGIARVITAWQP
jgi:hypothetical protein